MLFENIYGFVPSDIKKTIEYADKTKGKGSRPIKYYIYNNKKAKQQKIDKLINKLVEAGESLEIAEAKAYCQIILSPRPKKNNLDEMAYDEMKKNVDNGVDEVEAARMAFDKFFATETIYANYALHQFFGGSLGEDDCLELGRLKIIDNKISSLTKNFRQKKIRKSRK
ncbi:MAG: hypothetical protein HOD92_06670 [Deltaproteobacteria bacterium]|nr:hypothetical protein [Deltaproteobacteria bacterium]